MSTEIVPIEKAVWPMGKYKGQPVERAMADSSYMEWALAQPWFSERYTEIHKLVVNYGAEPQDSPEHNEFQMRFMDEAIRFAVARRLGYASLRESDYYKRARKVAKRLSKELSEPLEQRREELSTSVPRFEDRGWDVSFDITAASFRVYVRRDDLSTVIEMLEKQGLMRKAADMREYLESRFTPVLVNYSPNLNESKPVYIELKPDLGDDYPSVLRQMMRYPDFNTPDSKKTLIVRRAQFSSVSLEQVRKFFEVSGVVLLLESELDAYL